MTAPVTAPSPLLVAATVRRRQGRSSHGGDTYLAVRSCPACARRLVEIAAEGMFCPAGCPGR